MSANEDRKGLLLFRSHWDVIGELPPEEFKRVMQAIFASAGANCDMPEDMSLLERVAFAAVNGDVQRAFDKYTNISHARSEAGRKGGKKKAENARAKTESTDATSASLANSSKPSKASKATDATSASLANLANLHNDNDNDNDSDNDIDSGSDINIYLVENEPTQTENAAASTPCSADAEPRTRDASTPGDAQKGKPAQPRKREVDEHFEELWAMYPSKRGKNQVKDKTKRQLMGVRTEDMRKAIDRYVAEVEAAPYDRQWLNGSTWFNGRFLDYINDDYTPPPAVGGSSPRRYVSAEGPRDFSDREE